MPSMSIYRKVCSKYPNADHVFPVPEVQGIARSVERYRARWKAQGRFYSQAERTAWGTSRGIRSGQARRRLNETRDREIVQDRIEGLTIRAIAVKHNLTGRAVHHILTRDAPLVT